RAASLDGKPLATGRGYQCSSIQHVANSSRTIRLVAGESQRGSCWSSESGSHWHRSKGLHSPKGLSYRRDLTWMSGIRRLHDNVGTRNRGSLGIRSRPEGPHSQKTTSRCTPVERHSISRENFPILTGNGRKGTQVLSAETIPERSIVHIPR